MKITMLRNTPDSNLLQKTYWLLLIWVLLLLTSCAPGQLFGPTLTPTPTITQTPTRTQTPTVIRSPTPTHPHYFEGFANFDNPNIPIIKMEDIPDLITYLKNQPSHLIPNAEPVIAGDILRNNTSGTTEAYLICHPGSVALVATFKAEASVADRGVIKEIHPMYFVWEVMTPDGPRFITTYAYDEVQSYGTRHLARMAAVALPPPDETFSTSVQIGLLFVMDNPPPDRSYYGGILARPEYAQVSDLVTEWHTTGHMPPELEQLIFWVDDFLHN